MDALEHRLRGIRPIRRWRHGLGPEMGMRGGWLQSEDDSLAVEGSFEYHIKGNTKAMARIYSEEPSILNL